MCNSPVVVQFGLQFFLIAVHFNSFGVKMNSIDEVSSPEGLITLMPINICCGCKERIKEFIKKIRELKKNKRRNKIMCQSLWLYLISISV